jgi:hypothetical protein
MPKLALPDALACFGILVYETRSYQEANKRSCNVQANVAN